MKLDDYRTSSNVGDQRGRGGLRSIGGGKLSLGSIVILGIAALVFGVNPLDLIQSGAVPGTQSASAPSQVGGKTAAESCQVDAKSRFSCQVLASTEDTWGKIFQQ